MQTAIIYARYSSDRQTEQSIEGQLRVCQEYAERNNITIVDTYIDRAMTGTNDNRPAFKKMLQDSNKKAWDIVLVYKLDRFSRDKYEMAIHRRTLRNNGVKIVSAMENIPDTPEGVILEALLEGISHYYSLELSQKVRRGMKENRRKGYYCGGPIPFGYKKDGKLLVINENEANIVRYIFNEFANGRLVVDLTKELNDKGITNKGVRFARNTLYKILKNTIYSGTYILGNEKFDNMYPRIINQELFDTVQAKIEKNKYGKHKPDVCYLLKFKVKCGYCGSRVNSESGTSQNGDVKRYYKCSSKRNITNCKRKAIRKEVLEDIVVDTLLNTMSNDMIDYISKEVLILHEKKINDDTVLNLLLKEYNLVDKQINNLVDAIANGISTSSTKERLESLEEEKLTLSNKIAIEKSKEKMRLTQNDIIKFMRNAIKKSPQTLIDLLVREVVLYEDKVEIYINYTDNKTPDDQNHQAFCFYTTTTVKNIATSKFSNNSEPKKYTISLYI